MRAAVREGIGGHVEDGHDVGFAGGFVSLQRRMRGG